MDWMGWPSLMLQVERYEKLTEQTRECISKLDVNKFVDTLSQASIALAPTRRATSIFLPHRCVRRVAALCGVVSPMSPSGHRFRSL